MKKNIKFLIELCLLFMPLKGFCLPNTIETLDTRSMGVEINLFDYNAIDKSGYDSTYIGTQKINSITNLKFFISGGGITFTDEYPRASFFIGRKQGIVKNSLVDNYPVLYSYSENDESENNKKNKLSYIFDTNEIIDTVNNEKLKSVYKDVNNLFKRDENTGYLVYDSDNNYAYYDISQGNNGNFKVYDSTYLVYASKKEKEAGSEKNRHIGFFPFDEYNEDKDLTANTEDLNEDGIEGYNHHFGLTFSSNFLFPKNMQINGKDIIFNFSGDDDVWLFLDDVLILDLGGTHGSVSGNVNLTTGEIKYDADANFLNIYDVEIKPNEDPNKNNINQIFQNLGRTYDTAENSKHKINFFYLERGSNLSNMFVETNIWDISRVWDANFYKDNELMENISQTCTYSPSDFKCEAGAIENPTDYVFHIDSCDGPIVENFDSYSLNRDTDFYVCSEGKWDIRFFKDNKFLEEFSQSCPYYLTKNGKICDKGIITNPTEYEFKLLSCDGEKVFFSDLIVDKNIDLHTCTFINPQTGSLLIVFVALCLSSITAVFIMRKKI